MDILNKHIKVTRKDGSVRDVVIMLDRATDKYAFVNMTTMHICKCRFDTPKDALLDLQNDEFVESFNIEREMKTLFLPLKKEWYEMIESGEKKEEYRNLSPYWITRLLQPDNTTFKEYTHVKFTYGYTSRSMTFEIESISIDEGKVEWGANIGWKYFVIRLGNKIS